MDFAELRDVLSRAREAEERARDAAAAARERVARIESRLGQLSRLGEGEASARIRRKLEAELKTARAGLEAAREARRRTADLAGNALRAFAPLADPREGLGRLDDEIPILMMPVRLETRFGPVPPERAAARELWVRIYPDDCSIDTFEETLSDTEVQNARIYWTAVWQAGGAEDGQRAAWRALVGSHGSGRAEWIITQYRPLGSAPTKAAPQDVILAVPLDDGAVRGDEQTALASFWPAIWRAAGEPVATGEARGVLAEAVGADRAAALEEDGRPSNLDEKPKPPFRRPDVSVSTAFVAFPPADAIPTKPAAWTRAPRASLLPDRFVFIGYGGGAEPAVVLGAPIPSSLETGPDPYAPHDDRLQPDGTEVSIPTGMRWMVDFAEAERVGMGIRVPLTGERARGGFDRILVLGVRLATDPATSRDQLQTLFEHHRLGRSGLSLVPQGTPTNNVDDGPSGFSRVDDPDASFDAMFKATGAYPDETSALDKRDGQWLAEYLGFDRTAFKKVQSASGRDQADARAMNAALWPATLGYWMETMMQPVFDPVTVDLTRDFFTSYVSGRGAIPALRVGRQPYGILPATALSRPDWLSPRESFLRGLLGVLREMETDWANLSSRVSAVGRGDDPHRVLLDVVGLHPGSAELSTRSAESSTHLHNYLKFLRAAALEAEIGSADRIADAESLLGRLGYAGDGRPEMLERVFESRHSQLKGPIVDERPLSEKDALPQVTADGRNYLRWLIDAARQSLDTLYRQEGFASGVPPVALLYLMLRHALQLGYHDASVRAHVGAGLLTSAQASVAKRDETFLHVRGAAAASESRYALLFKTAEEITGSATVRLADYLAARLTVLDASQRLAQQVSALERLQGASTARLERAFLEHVDCCTYRLDAWLLGFVHLQLERMRGLRGGLTPRTGIHLGAYAWLEDVRPDPEGLAPVALPDDLARVFQRKGDPVLRRDPANLGFIHAPSENHAVTAAVLRNGYLSNASAANQRTLAVNLSSERVRTALAILEGMRGGQTLGALLGYRFERGLHDRHGLAEVDQFVFKLRKAFPLSADRLASTRTADDVPIEAIEARNVVDGLALARHVQAPGNASYPFGKPLSPATPAQAAAIDAEVQRLIEAYDAVADLGLAEAVHQAVLGNPDRAAANADALGRGQTPPEPEVVRTPSRGIGLTHRVGLQLAAGADPAASPVAALPLTPRAHAEPAVNRWLTARLPPLDDMGCVVAFRSAATGLQSERQVTLRDVRLQPLDLVLLVSGDGRQSMTELDDRLLAFAAANFGPRPDIPVVIRYMDKTTARFSIFEVLPLLRALRRLITLSRPLRASDLALMNEAAEDLDAAPYVDPQRIVLARGKIQAARDAVAGLQATLDQPLGEVDVFTKAAKALRAAIDGPDDVLRLQAARNALVPAIAAPASNVPALQAADAALQAAIGAPPLAAAAPLEAAIAVLNADVAARLGAIVAAADGWVDDLAARLPGAALAGVTQAGWGFAFDFRRRTFGAIQDEAARYVRRWDGRLADHDVLIATYDALPGGTPDEERFGLLQRAERLVATALTSPRPATPAALRAAVTAQRGAFQARRDQLDAIKGSHRTSVSLLLADVEALLPLTAFDLEDLSFDEEKGACVRFAADAAAVCRVVSEEMDRRLTAAAGKVVEHDGSANAAVRARAMGEAAVALLGEGCIVIPEFALAPTQGDELAAAVAASGGRLLDHVTTTAGVDFPVDTWLYGLARVRSKLRTWEEVVLLCGAFGRAEPELTALQLPVLADDRWLGLQFPPDIRLDVDRLLYTAHFETPFAKDERQCGLLLDEWTEVIPGPDVTTGIAFHYDRPNQEAPQAMLLVTPTAFRQGWQWRDLVDALNETLERAKSRAVEPVHLEGTAYAPLLPATVMAVTANQLTISAVLAVNNGLRALPLET